VVVVDGLRAFSSFDFSRYRSILSRAALPLAALPLAAFGARGACARVVINEIYYDHPGADAGYEFVELVNDGSVAVDLSGFAIEFHNGSGAGWTVLWRAPAGASLGPDTLFVVGGESVAPRPDAVVALTLQNGPDAVRLVAALGGVLDLVGYGGLDDPAYVETAAVPAVAAGQSIARRRDAFDSGDNAADFAAATPTPGRRNVARHDVALRLAPGTPARSESARAGAERVAVLVAGQGLEAVPAGAVSLAVTDSSAAGVEVLAAAPTRGPIPPGAEEKVTFSLSLAPGYHWLRVESHYARDERPGNDAVALLRRGGRIPILVSEVWSAPREGCPQFVEVMNAGQAAVDLGAFSLRDARARPVPLARDSLRLEPGTWVAVTADVDRLVACVPGTPRERVVGVDGSWPTFNRSGGEPADSVFLFDPFGIPVEAVGYPPLPADAAGRSLERVDLFLHDGPAVWRLCPSPAGASPGRPNDAFLDRPAAANRMEASPNPFSPWRGEVLRVALNPLPPVARADAWVFDLEGRRVASLGAAASFPALVVWDGRRDDGEAAPPGLYVVACEWFRGDGTRLSVQRVVVGCAHETVP
jgi:hypothetical protein